MKLLKNLEMEGAGISDAYLYGNVDVFIFICQLTNPTVVEEYPGMICELLKLIYGLK